MEKIYNEQSGVGKSKYVVNYNDGVKKHKDGSLFFDIEIFKNLSDKKKFISDLKHKGYKYKYANGGGLADVPESFPETDAMSYKNGGSVKVGDKVTLPEIKMRDGKMQFEKVENGEVLSIENGIYDVLNPKTNRIHRVTLNQIKYKDGGGTWKVNDVSKAKHLGIIEFQDNEGEYHNFEVMETEDRLVFGGFSNSGFIESGYIEKDGFSTDEVLQELLSDLETYYNDGKEYTSMIVVNDRMALGGSTKGFEYSIGGL